ncbi:rRNA N6-adenosine-methyltransferase ZCCHC4-like [Strongylocentrotus purpuratus]|uniref:Zinc finger CCHC domain-containing protein 4 n=1 Tax=Strongylocentrotus purpuratus TaxID=7668 RepID=A0A7M7SZ61_STRPU|nr:rRNA N6-adenosine-methyltransferase ZCCHC4-like [Strongylocentrotus purpuratus]
MCAAVSSSHCGIDVCVDEDVLSKAPHCPHGPTLLFERFTPGKDTSQRYYACSACRDRKDCGFFQLHTNAEIVSDFKQQMREEYNRSRQPWKRQEDYYQRFITTESLAEDERTFCYDCQLLILPDEQPDHIKHRTKKGITNPDLAKPSYLMEAIENNKTNAQYLFSTKAVAFFIQTVKALGFKRVLCVGVPRLHEQIMADTSSGLESLLLDIDHRFGQFYPPSQFCRYNMFNHYFLDGAQSQESCREFLTRDDGEGVVMVTDPPFGGMVDALASGVKWIMEMWRSNVTHVSRSLPVMWIFPYFLEHRIIEGLQGFKMLDYKVDYDNHPLFKGGPDAKKKGSPVRIFTNLDPAKIELPTSEGYRLCKECHRYVAAENIHCSKCQECPSKNGTTYTHCEICNKCVKPSFSHCTKCNMCELATHDCGKVQAGCHVCGALDHKRRDCPKRSSSSSKKRSYEEAVSSDASKLLTWPKRKKRKNPALSSVLRHFRPVEEQAVGTPRAAVHPTISKRPSENGVQSPGSLGSPCISATVLSPLQPLQLTPMTKGIQSPDEAIERTVQPDDSSMQESPCPSKVDGNDNILEGSINGSSFSTESSVVESPRSLRKGQSLSSLSGIGTQDVRKGRVDGKKMSKLKSKKKKLMERIEKLRMKRKITLKL